MTERSSLDHKVIEQRSPRKTTLIKDMARVHTHYDNLKVTRDASDKVIRAAYRTLLWKYHLDRNPGDSEAARIVRIINQFVICSYCCPIKRNKHDIWIAAQEKTHLSVACRSNDFTALKRQPHRQRLDLHKSSFKALGS